MKVSVEEAWSRQAYQEDLSKEVAFDRGLGAREKLGRLKASGLMPSTASIPPPEGQLHEGQVLLFPSCCISST